MSSKNNKCLSRISIFLMIFAFIGLMDAGYLTLSHYTGEAVNCSITGGCDQVLSSKWSQIMGIPLALLGLLHYLVFLILSIAFFDTKKKIILKVLTAQAIVGALFSAWLTYLQFFVIESICQYCILSAINSVILLFFVCAGMKKSKD